MRLLCFVCKGFVDPLFDLPFGFCLRCAIAFLDLASQRIHIAFNLLDVIVGEFAPLVTYASTHFTSLFPVPILAVLLAQDLLVQLANAGLLEDVHKANFWHCPF